MRKLSHLQQVAHRCQHKRLLLLLRHLRHIDVRWRHCSVCDLGHQGRVTDVSIAEQLRVRKQSDIVPRLNKITIQATAQMAADKRVHTFQSKVYPAFTR